MKFNVEQKTLVDALGRVARTADSVYSQVRIAVSEDKISFQTSDSVRSSISYVTGEINGVGEALVDFKTLITLAKKLPDGTLVKVQETSDGRQLSVKAGRSQFKLNVLPEREWADFMEASEADDRFTISGETLERIARMGVFASKENTSMPVLEGIHFEDFGGKLECAALDGYKAMRETFDTTIPNGMNINIPGKSILDVSSIIDDDSEVTIRYNGNAIHFEMSDCAYQSRLLGGAYLDYRKILCNMSDTSECTIRAQQFIEALKRMELITGKDKCLVRVQFLENEIHLESRDDAELAQETVDCINKTESDVIGFNIQYLIRSLEVFGDYSEDVVLEYSGPYNPLKIKPASDDDAEAIVLPVRMSN